VVSNWWPEKAARTVGALDHSFRKARLTDECSLLIPRHTEDRDLGPEPLGIRGAELGGTVQHGGQDRLGNAEVLEHFCRPRLRLDIE
jgi:hypothetical protein